MPHSKIPASRRRTRGSRTHLLLQQQVMTLQAALHDVLRQHAESQLALGQLLATHIHTAEALKALHRQQQALDTHREAMTEALGQLDRRLDDVETYLEDEDNLDAASASARLH